MKVTNENISDNRQSFTAALKHYVCMRLHFRSTVLKESDEVETAEKQIKQQSPIKH